MILQYKSLMKKITVALFTLMVCLYPTAAYAATKEESYEYMNTILLVAVTIGGFLVIFSIITAGVKLAASRDNPQERTAGIISLGFALLGGYMVYKALDIAGYIQGFFGI